MKSVFVTGASTGIGHACAIDLDRRGLRVYAGVRKEADAESLRKESARIEPVILDVTDQATIDAAAKQIDELYGLVNNAGITVPGPLEYLPVDELRRQFEVNLFGQIAVTQAFLPLIRKARGRIVFVSSVGGRTPPPPFMGPYQASKHALETVADALRVELGPSGIDVVLIQPGSIATPMWEKGLSEGDRLAAALPAEAVERYGEAVGKVRNLAASLGKRGIPAEKVAEKVALALTARRPRIRYLVGTDARAQAALFAVMSDRMRDRLYGRLSGLRKR